MTNIKTIGDLAESHGTSLPDGLQIIFHLRKNVLWHDGAEFTADDVLFTYNTVIDPCPKIPNSIQQQLWPHEIKMRV